MAVLTPTQNTRAEDFDLLEAFWSSLGSMVVQMSAQEHDKALALTSHLPHVAAAALATLVPEKLFPLGGHAAFWIPRGWPPAIRDLWTQIFTAQPRQRLGRPPAVRGESTP